MDNSGRGVTRVEPVAETGVEPELQIKSTHSQYAEWGRNSLPIWPRKWGLLNAALEPWARGPTESGKAKPYHCFSFGLELNGQNRTKNRMRKNLRIHPVYRNGRFGESLPHERW